MRLPSFPSRLLCGMLCLASFHLQAAESDRDRLWAEVDIVPMPKEIRLTGGKLPLDPGNVVLVVGENPSRQSEFGAQWINKRLADQGGKPLPVARGEAAAKEHAMRIVIGTREDNALIAGAADGGVVKVGPGNPGTRGYEVRITKDAKTIYLAGADPIGALYACVTLGELLERDAGGPPVFKAAEVRDWPDIQYLYVLDNEPPSDIVKHPDSPEARQRYLDKMTKMYDDMLRRKLSMVWYKPLAWGQTAFRDMTPYARESARMAIEAGKDRGIASLYYHLYPFVGPAADHPKVDPDLLEQKPKTRYGTWIQSWSMDEERRAYAKELAQWIKEVGFTDVGFHDTDTGGYLNPANWNNRGKADRERWGDDYTGATINKFKIFYEELKKANPELRINLTLYPYNSEIFDPSETVKAGLQKSLHLDAAALERFRERYTSFWKRLNEAFPKKDVAFAIREPWTEDGEPGLKAFLSFIPGRPLFAWYGLAASEFYCNVPAWLGSLHSGNVDDIVFTQNIYVDKGYVPLLSLAMREYSWNTKAPGAARFQKRDRARMFDSAAGDNTTEAFSVVLPHLVRNYFGDSLAPEITKAIRENCSPYIVFGGRPERNITDETEGRMSLEAARAGAAAQAMDAAWEKAKAMDKETRPDPEVLARVSYLRQVFHSTALAAGVKEEVYRSQRLSSINRFADALASVEKGAAALRQGRQTLKALAEEGPQAINGLPYTAQATLQKTVPLLQNLLDQRSVAINASKSSGGISTRVLNLIAEDQKLPIVKTGKAPVIDGSIDEPEWRDAYPMEAWFIAGPDRLVADAPTRVRVLSDDNNLYIAFKCGSPAGEEVGLKDEDREFVRIYLQRSTGGETAMSAFSVWANGKLETYDKTRANPVEFKVTHERESWQGEIRIPFEAVGGRPGGQPWRIGFVRGYSHSGVRYVSSTVPVDAAIAGPFDAARPLLGAFPLAQWDQEPFRATARIRIVDPKVVREVTLDDRIATVVEFGVTAEADCVLDNVTLVAEARDAAGKVEASKGILDRASLTYQLKPAETFHIAFLQAVDKGSIHIKLKSDQATGEAVHAFGDEKAAKGESRAAR